jgi:hypothetical protein
MRYADENRLKGLKHNRLLTIDDCSLAIERNNER